eukprot:scaffold219283_cov21-Tisochrysis_lutea.AAC.1
MEVQELMSQMHSWEVHIKTQSYNRNTSSGVCIAAKHNPLAVQLVPLQYCARHLHALAGAIAGWTVKVQPQQCRSVWATIAGVDLHGVKPGSSVEVA